MRPWLVFTALILIGWAPPRLVLEGDVTADSALPAEDPDSVPALYLRFDNDGAKAGAVAGVVVDEGSPVANSGVATNGPMYISTTFGSPIPQTGQPNPLALDLRAAQGQYLTVPYHPCLAFAGASFTLEAWVKLHTVADGMGPQDRAWLMVRKELGESDDSIEYAFLVQMGAAVHSDNAFGKSEDLTGNELGVILGDAADAGQWALISHLEITDTDWHYVSAAVDVDAQQARFTLDEFVDEFAFEDQGHTFNQGPLIVGAHPNAQGNVESPLDASIDEIRVSRGVVPLDELLAEAGTGGGWPTVDYTLDFGTVAPDSGVQSLTFQVVNDGLEGSYSLEGELDWTGVDDTRVTVTGPTTFGPLDRGETSDPVTVSLDTAAEGPLEDLQLVVSGTANSYGFAAVGSPAPVTLAGSVGDPPADDDDTSDDDDDDADDDDSSAGGPDYQQGCSCDGAAATRAPLAWLLAAVVLLLRRRPSSRG